MSASDSTTKRCCKCGVEYPPTLEFFNSDRNTKDGLYPQCKHCRKAKRQTPVERERERLREQQPERKAYKQEYNRSPKNKEYMVEYRQRDEVKARHREQERERRKRPDVRLYLYEYERREDVKARKREKKRSPQYREWENQYIKLPHVRSKRRDYAAEYIRTPKGKIIAKVRSARYRGTKREAEGFHTVADLQMIFFEQGGLCAYCGIRLCAEIRGDIHIDHIFPLSRGGSNWPDNLAMTCQHCNTSKQDKTVDEWEASRGW